MYYVYGIVFVDLYVYINATTNCFLFCKILSKKKSHKIIDFMQKNYIFTVDNLKAIKNTSYTLSTN